MPGFKDCVSTLYDVCTVTNFSERIPVVKQRITVYIYYKSKPNVYVFFTNRTQADITCLYPYNDKTILPKNPTNALYMLTPLDSQWYTPTYFSPQAVFLREYSYL
jgi:hypothetical protein